MEIASQTKASGVLKTFYYYKARKVSEKAIY